MPAVTIFHNLRCSKSRGALAVLEAQGIEHEVVRYLDAPPDRAALERILDAIDDPPAALVRTGDPGFRALGAAAPVTRAEVVELLLAHPELMERPVVLRGARGVIGRPVERVERLLAGP